MSKVIRDCIGFALLCSVSGLENSRHLLSQSDTKLKPITTWLHAFTSISHWLPLIFSFVLIGRCDYFGFGFTTLNRKALYSDSKRKLQLGMHEATIPESYSVCLAYAPVPVCKDTLP